MESVFSNNLLHVTYEVLNIIYYASYDGQSWTTPVQVSTTGQNGNTPRISAYYYGGNDFVYFMYKKYSSNDCKWRRYNVNTSSWDDLYTGFNISGLDSYTGFRVDGSNIVIYFIWHEQDPWQYYFAWVVLDLSNNFIRYGNADLSAINWRMYSTPTADGKTHTAFYYVQYAGEDYSDIGLWRSNDGAAFPTDELLEYEDHEDVWHLNISSAGNEVHVIWKDQYGNNGGNNLRYKYDDQVPLAPTGLGITEGAYDHPQLDWDPNLEPDINNYKIWKNEGNGWYYLNQTNNNSYLDITEIYCHLPTKLCWDVVGYRTVSYRITAVDLGSNESNPSDAAYANLIDWDPNKIITDPKLNEPVEYSLAQNYPNPFNPTTTIYYSIKSIGLVTLKVFDMLGKEVASLVDSRKEPGNYSVEFNAANLPSGIYFYTLTSGKFMDTKKLILLK
jgi:hypothetical protein